MVHRIQYRKRYPSDLTDEQWAILGPMIPPTKQSKRGGRPRKVDMREVLNTIFYLNRSGCQWDMLPHDVLPKSTVYDYFAQWRDDGCSLANTLRIQRLEFGREQLTKGPDVIRHACRQRWRALSPSGTNRPMVFAFLRRQRLP
jgi:transposase